MTRTTHDVSDTSRRRMLAVAALVVSMALLLAGFHAVALHLSRIAAGSGPVAKRSAAARFAARIEPWDSRLVGRARVLARWEEGQRMLDAGNYNGAVEALREAYAGDVGNPELLTIFKRAQAEQALETNRKAHLQHGHEGPGGTLAPEDVER